MIVVLWRISGIVENCNVIVECGVVFEVFFRAPGTGVS